MVEVDAPVFVRVQNVLVAVVPAHVGEGVVLPRADVLRESRVMALDRQDEGRAHRLEIGLGHAKERACLVNRVEKRPAQDEQRVVGALQGKRVEAPDRIAFGIRLGLGHPEARLRVGDHVVAGVGGADHQRRLAVVMADDGVAREDEAGAGPREAREDEPRHHRDEDHAGENLDRRDEVPVMGLRVHVAVADGRQRLDREIEKLQVEARGRVGDRVFAERVEQRIEKIDADEHGSRAAEEARPARGHAVMVEVVEEKPVETFRDDLALADADDALPRARWFLGGHAHGFWSHARAARVNCGKALLPLAGEGAPMGRMRAPRMEHHGRQPSPQPLSRRAGDGLATLRRSRGP